MPKVYAISDLHVDYAENMQSMLALSNQNYTDDTLIVAGDVSDSLEKLEALLKAMRAKFRNVCFVPGNHELWLREKTFAHSIAKFDHILELCEQYDIFTRPFIVDSDSASVWLVPLFSWYRTSENDEHSLFIEKATEIVGKSRWMDDILCSWPDELADNVSKVADYFCSLNERAIKHCENQQYDNEQCISFSHFLPRKELIFANPEHALEYCVDGAILPPHELDPTPRFNFTRVAGCEKLEHQIRQLGPKLHVYGHQHSQRARLIDGLTYVSNCVGYSRERGHLGDKVMPLCIWDDGVFIQPKDEM